MSELSGSFISIDESNKNTSKSSIQQLVDIVQSDIASISSTTRKSYEVFVSGGVNLHPITSSLYQTVFDQDFTLGTSNPLFDITIGSLEETTQNEQGVTSVSVNGVDASYDAGGKLIFSLPDGSNNNSVSMMREKVNIYKQFAQNLLGDSNEAFVSPHGEIPPTTPSSDPDVAVKEAKKIKAAVFLCFRRLFTRDNIFKGSFGLKLHKKASLLYSDFVYPIGEDNVDNRITGTSISNIDTQADVNSGDNNIAVIYDDRISTTNISVSPIAGEVSTLMDSNSNPIGLIYYDSGIIVLDVERAFDPDQTIRGLVDSTRVNDASDTTEYSGPFYVYGRTDADGEGYFYPLYTSDFSGENSEAISGLTVLDKDGAEVDVSGTSFYYVADDVTLAGGRPTNGEPLFVPSASNNYYSSSLVNEFDAGDGKSQISEALYPGLWTKSTIDDVLDHVCTTRFGRGNMSAISFRNETVINSSLIFCRAAPSQLNYSTNPTYKDSDGNIIALNSSNEPFSFVTTVGLYDADRFLLAVAKTSRPIEKNPETDLSIRIRLDY